MFNWLKKKEAGQPTVQRTEDYLTSTKQRYKLVQHAVTMRWAVWDTEMEKGLDFSSQQTFWWSAESSHFPDCWVTKKGVAEAVLDAVRVTGYPWK